MNILIKVFYMIQQTCFNWIKGLHWKFWFQDSFIVHIYCIKSINIIFHKYAEDAVIEKFVQLTRDIVWIVRLWPEKELGFKSSSAK